MSRHLLARAVAAAAVVLTATACSPGDDAPPAEPAAAGSRPGGTLVVALPRPGSVDPLDAYEPSGVLIARTMCDTLLEIDPEDGSVRPGLAASWQLQDGGTQLSLRLRKGARFSDGRRVTAADVVFSLSRAASPAFAGRSAELLAPIAGWPELRGETETRDPRARRELLGVRALTGDTVRIDLRQPLADAVRLFTHPVTAPVSKRATEADPDRAASQPVCSGPYRLAAPWSGSADRAVLERVAGYRGRSSTRTRAGAGYADRIELRFTSPAGPDAPGGGSAVDDADVVVDPAAPSPAAAAERVTGPAPGAELIGLPAGTNSPFRAVEVRRALSLALDRRAIAAAVGAGSVEPAGGFVPPTVAGVFRPGACRRAVPAGADLAEARRLLAAAPVELQATILQLHFNDEGRNRAVVEAVAAQWREGLGLQVQPTAVPFEQLLSTATLGAGLSGPFRLSWAAPYPSADAHLVPLFAGGSTTQANLGRWNDPEWDRSLFREARKADDEDDRVVQYRALEDRLCRTIPAIPLLWDRAVLDVRTDRVGAPGDRYLDPLTGEVALRDLWRR